MSLLPRLRGTLPPVHLVVLLAAIASLSLAGCTPDSPKRPQPIMAHSTSLPASRAESSPASCTPPSTWQHDEKQNFYYVALGPLRIFESPREVNAAAVLLPGRPTKVPITVTQTINRMILSGYNCESGKPLTFWYGHGGSVPLSPLPAPASALAQAGSAEQPLGPVTISSDGPTHLGGYMLFTTPGRWHLMLQDSKGGMHGQCTVTIVGAG